MRYWTNTINIIFACLLCGCATQNVYQHVAQDGTRFSIWDSPNYDTNPAVWDYKGDRDQNGNAHGYGSYSATYPAMEAYGTSHSYKGEGQFYHGNPVGAHQVVRGNSDMHFIIDYDEAGNFISHKRTKGTVLGEFASYTADSYENDPNFRNQMNNTILQAIGENSSSQTYEDFAALKPNSVPAGNVIGQVTIDALMAAHFSNGYAYDVLVVLPDGKTAGELCYQYGISLDNARTLLANSYAATGESSAYGAGNPRSLISWRRYPVRAGQSIKMGIEWKRGQSYATPFSNRYATSKP